MFKRVIIIVFAISILVTGCASQNDNSSSFQPPKFEVAADKQNDPVGDLTPEINEALIQAYTSDSKIGANRQDFIKVVNSLHVQGGIVFIVRVKDGFSMFFRDNVSNEISFIIGDITDDVSNNPMSYSVAPIKPDSSVMIFVGYFNLANAKEVSLTWDNGKSKSYKLTNGTIMISPFDKKTSLKSFEIRDKLGNILFK